jgi:hypothetical protein
MRKGSRMIAGSKPSRVAKSGVPGAHLGGLGKAAPAAHGEAPPESWSKGSKDSGKDRFGGLSFDIRDRAAVSSRGLKRHPPTLWPFGVEWLSQAVAMRGGLNGAGDEKEIPIAPTTYPR